VKAPLFVVSEVAARLVRRGLVASSEVEATRWAGARVLVFRDEPVVYELAARVDAPSAAFYVSAVPVSRDA
jgi:hypothetical protein